MTSFIGASDSGKSAILRALTWVLTNQPRGNAFINSDSTECKVGAEVDGKLVIRTKGSQNSYKVDGVEYKSFGIGVPNELAALTKLSPASVQRQMDPPFWLTESPKGLANCLNEICDYDLLDKIQKKAKSMLITAADQLKYHETLVTSTEEKLEGLPLSGYQRGELYAEAADLERLDAEWIDAAIQQGDLINTISELTKMRESIEPLPDNHEELVKAVDEILTLEKTAKLLEMDCNHITDYLSERTKQGEYTQQLASYVELSAFNLEKAEELDKALQEAKAAREEKPIISLPTTAEVCPTCLRPL